MAITAAISEGHTDLADLLFLLAFICATIALVVEALSTKTIVRLAAFAAGALVALAWFVL